MIDLHCHILPDVDDGSPDMNESLAMAAMAAESGVTDIAATSHFYYERERAQQMKERLRTVTEQLQQEIDKNGIDLRLHTGAEIMCSQDTPELFADGLLPTISGTDYLLVEFAFNTHAEQIDNLMEQLTQQGARIILAHPERYMDVQHKPDFLIKWFQENIILQCNKGSILGALGSGAMRTSRWLLDRGLVHIVASDAHTARVRTPRMTELRNALDHYWGEDYAEVLLDINPSRILDGKPVLSPDEEEDEE